MPKVSVIMPVYKTNPSYLRHAISSILKQSLSDFEFLILNDSPDNAEIDKIVAEYKDERIHYFKSEQTLGVGGAYSELLKHTNGEYVAVMNHDDIALPKRMEKQVAFLDANPDVGLVGTGCKKFGSFWRFHRFSSVVMPKNNEDILALLWFKSPIIHPTIMVRKSVLDKYNISYNEKYISLNDRLFYIDISKHSKLANLDEVLYKYRFHTEMTSRVQKLRIDAEQYEFKKQWLEEHGIVLNEIETAVYFNYLTRGRARIRDKQTLKVIQSILEKLNDTNQKEGFLDKNAFREVCGKYLTKRCMNAALWGRISAKDVVDSTTLPIEKSWLFKLSQTLLGWKK